MQEDLITKLGAKPVEKKVETAVETNISKEAIKPAVEVKEQSDLIAKVTSTVESQKSNLETSTASKKDSSKVEPSGTVTDPDTWTKDSALKEIKRLRDENKTYRVKYEEKLESLKSEMDKRIVEKDTELQEYSKLKKDLDAVKAQELDKERNLSEKLANREAVLAELKTKMESSEKEYRSKLGTLETELHKHQVEIEAQREVYKQRLQSELESIPEKYKDIADLIVKGAGDSRDALMAINEAKLRGVFEDKTVVVNHSVPGAKDGARSSKEKLEEIEKDERNKMTSSQKIKAALQGIRQGSSNTAFRANR